MWETSVYTLDCMGDNCNVALDKTREQLEMLDDGDILVISVDKSCAVKTIPPWAREQGFNVDISEISSREWEIILERE